MKTLDGRRGDTATWMVESDLDDHSNRTAYVNADRPIAPRTTLYSADGESTREGLRRGVQCGTNGTTR